MSQIPIEYSENRLKHNRKIKKKSAGLKKKSWWNEKHLVHKITELAVPEIHTSCQSYFKRIEKVESLKCVYCGFAEHIIFFVCPTWEIKRKDVQEKVGLEVEYVRLLLLLNDKREKNITKYKMIKKIATNCLLK